MVFAVLFAAVSVAAYVYLIYASLQTRQYGREVRKRLDEVTAPPLLYTLDESEAVQVVDDGASPLSSGAGALDW